MLECTSCLSVCSLIYFQTFPSLLCFIKDSLLCFIKDYIMQSLSSLPPGYVWLIGGTIEDEGRWKEEARVFPPCSLSAPRGIFGNNCNSSFHDPCHRPPPISILSPHPSRRFFSEHHLLSASLYVLGMVVTSSCCSSLGWLPTLVSSSLPSPVLNTLFKIPRMISAPCLDPN